MHRSESPSCKSQQIINAGEGMGKKRLSYTVDGHINWYGHYGHASGENSNSKRYTHLNIHSHTISKAKTWQQKLKCPSMDEWINKMDI